MNLQEILQTKQINTPDQAVYEASKAKWDSVAKPLNSLGKFEEAINRIAAINGTTELFRGRNLYNNQDNNQDNNQNSKTPTAILYVFAADNGVVEEGISQSGQDVTAICSRGIADGKHSVAVMATKAGVDLQVVDVGINGDVSEDPNILNKKVRMGTRNFAKEPAMTEKEVIQAMETGFELVAEAKEKGYELVCLGEMGIGNTTTSTAIAASLLGFRAEEITGRGAGLDSAKLQTKKNVIQSAIDKHGLYNADPMTVLRTVGGFDIAAMAGAYIGGAAAGIPVVMDGVISAVAALVAERLVPGTKEYIIPSHMSGEPAMRKITEELNLSPIIDAHMSLGEGTGAILMAELLSNVAEVYNHAARFEERDIAPYEHLK